MQAHRIPRRAPVTVVHLRANNDTNGNPRRCFVVVDHCGNFVEAIDEGYLGESALFARYPWFNYYACKRLGLEQSWFQVIDTTPAEYQRMLRRDGSSLADKVRAAADRYEARFDSRGEVRS